MAVPPSRATPRDAAVSLVLDQEVQALCAKGAIEQIFAPLSPGFYGHLFCVPKATGGWRPVLDLSPLNVFLRKIRFKMETASSIREAIRPRDWATSVDLTDAYFHITIHPRDRRWLRFVWKDKVY